MITRLLLTIVLFAAGACSTLPPAPAKVTSESFRYVIGPGDKLQISVWRNPELSATVPVSPDGKITSPLIENMLAAGKSPEALAREIEHQLTKFIREPTVTVVVTEFVGNSEHQVRVVGQAVKPSAIPYRQGMTVLDVMIKVGGITEFAAGNRAVLIRTAEDNKQYRVRLQDLLKGGDVSANVELLPGDVIMIPEGLL